VYRYSNTGGAIGITQIAMACLLAILSHPTRACCMCLRLVTPLPTVPQNLRVESQSASFVELEWDAVADASLFAYDLYRSEISATLGVKIQRILAPDTSYVDADVNSGTTYFYVVHALDENFNSRDTPTRLKQHQNNMVEVRLNVTVPAYTPAGAPVYDPGHQSGWYDRRLDSFRYRAAASRWSTYTATLQIQEGTQIEFKFPRYLGNRGKGRYL
jgi:hypothetical protein